MLRKIIVWCVLLALAISAAGCSKKESTEPQTTTLTGMVVSVDGTVVNLMQMSGSGNSMGSLGGQRPEGGNRPEGDFTMPEGGFTMPEGGFDRPEGDFTMPEGDFTVPEGMEGFSGNFDPNSFDGTLPEGMTMPENGQMPSFGNIETSAETTAVDLKNAHISVQDGDIKAAGSMSDIKAGSFLTITLNANGEATEVLVSSMSSFSNFGGASFGGGSFGGGRGQGGNGQGSSGNTDDQA